MADELDLVEQQFIAEVTAYVDEVRRAADDARTFAASNRDAKDAVDGLRDHAVEAGTALGHVRDEALEAAEAEKKLGTASEETAAKLDLMGLSGAGAYASLAPLIGMIGGLVIAGAAVAPALASAGLGLGAFGLVAIANYRTASTAAQQVQAAQIAYNAAVANGTKQAVAYRTEQIAIAKAYAQLSPAQIALSKEINNAQNAWQSFVQANTAGVSKVLTQGLGLLPRVFQILQQLIGPTETAVSGLITSIGQGLNSAGFRQFLSLMTSMIGPSIQAITRLAFTILGVLGQALEQLAPLSVPFINFITVLVSALGGPAVAALHVIISLFLGLAKAVEPLLPGLSKIATVLINDIGSSFSAFIPIITQVVGILGGSLLKILTDLMPVIANVLTPNSGFMLALGMLPGLLRAILPLFTGLAALFADPHIAQLAAMIITLVVAYRGLLGVIALVRGAFILLTAVMEVNPIILILTAIAALVVGFIYLWDHCAAFRKFWIGLWHDITAAVDAAVGWIRSHWQLILAILTGPVGVAAAFIITHWHQIVAGAQQMFRDVVSFFERLPGNIARAVGNLGRLLWNAGVAVIDGLLNGIKSAAGGVLNFVGGLGSDISGAFSSVLHILSPSRVFYQHGVNTLLGYIQGLKAAAPQVLAAMRGIGGQVASGGLSAASLGPAGAMPNATVNITAQFNPGTAALNDPRFLQFLQPIIQEATLRYQVNNASNGLSSAWGTR